MKKKNERTFQIKSKKKIIAGVIIAGVVVGGLVLSQSGVQAGAGGGIAPYVQAYEVRRNTLESTITAQGEVSLLQFTVASIENTLEVAEVLINQNDEVSEGQPLIRFNTNMTDRQRERERLQSQLRDTELMLASQQVQLNNMQVGPTSLEIENATLQVRRAEQALEDAQFALNQFEINLELQQRELEPLQISLENAIANIANAEAQVTSAGIQLSTAITGVSTAESTFLNTQILYNAGGVTRNQLEQAETALENAVRQVEQAENSLENAVRQVEQAERNVQDIETRLTITAQQIENSGNQREQLIRNISAAEDNVRISELSLIDLRNRTSHAQNLNAISQQEIAIQRTGVAIEEIRRNIAILDDVEEYLYAPTSGTITAINVSQGSLAQARQPLVHISNAEDYVLRAFVNERHAAGLALGQQVLIEGSILGNNYLFGTIESISNIATTTQVGGVVERVVPIEIAVSDDSILIPGVTLDITVTTDVRENVVSLPILSTLVDSSNGESFVFVINNENVLSIRNIEILTYADMYVEVVGINEGERIVLQPQPTMDDGITVNIVD
ncbi:MAG: HlyD family efflux transporter periplasmic adaptor subunit [Defluviitaleaceae bacterium]|nr:HlyD family efflux transporter periplasmic adaptor subunit [Defluviitaleaceae bacterium]